MRHGGLLWWQVVAECSTGRGNHRWWGKELKWIESISWKCEDQRMSLTCLYPPSAQRSRGLAMFVLHSNCRAMACCARTKNRKKFSKWSHGWWCGWSRWCLVLQSDHPRWTAGRWLWRWVVGGIRQHHQYIQKYRIEQNKNPQIEIPFSPRQPPSFINNPREEMIDCAPICIYSRELLFRLNWKQKNMKFQFNINDFRWLQHFALIVALFDLFSAQIVFPWISYLSHTITIHTCYGAETIADSQATTAECFMYTRFVALNVFCRFVHEYAFEKWKNFKIENIVSKRLEQEGFLCSCGIPHIAGLFELDWI